MVLVGACAPMHDINIPANRHMNLFKGQSLDALKLSDDYRMLLLAGDGASRDIIDLALNRSLAERLLSPIE